MKAHTHIRRYRDEYVQSALKRLCGSWCQVNQALSSRGEVP